MRLFLHVLRMLCYICAFVALFCGSNLFGYYEWDFTALMIDLAMAGGLALLGIVFSYIRTYLIKQKETENKKG
ncbi:MAG: hypothetical protein HFE63_01735 [Clostridiales bacterium]|nr:hypothetical protein [Clostridiales bacterium]